MNKNKLWYRFRYLIFVILFVVLFAIVNRITEDNHSDDSNVSQASSSYESVLNHPDSQTITDVAEDATYTVVYTFRNADALAEHYEKHGVEMGFSSAEEYEAAASAVVNNPNALHKLEAEDGDDVYYLEDTNEFVIVSTKGFIRTYFNPSRGIDYYNEQ